MITNALGLIGKTPIVNLSSLLPEGSGSLYAKLEGFNPGGSIKDRPALTMIEEAESKGLLKPGSTIVESTSGNLGVALAMICAVNGYKCIIVVDPRANNHNLNAIRAYGASVDLVTEFDPIDGTYQLARIKRVKHLASTIPGAFMPWQYGNPNNPEAHYRSTGMEIDSYFAGKLDCLVATVSTAGHLSGISRYLKHRGRTTVTVGVGVKGSVIFGGQKSPTAVTGMGLAWVPENLDESVVDEAYLTTTDQCFSTVRAIARSHGILLGGSSGASLFVAIHKAITLGMGSKVLAIAPDRGDKYLDELYDDDWLEEKGIISAKGIEPVIEDTMHLKAFRFPQKELESKLTSDNQTGELESAK
ncbi:MAG: cysteine synthase family protein [Sedimenticola sp.]